MRPLWCLALGLVASASHADAIDDFVRDRMTKDRIPGCAVAIIPMDGPPSLRAYGVANLETNSPYTVDTAHRVASLTKQFTAYAVLSLEKEGKLNRSDSIRKFWPEVPEEWAPMTIAHLLAHRSGIADFDREFDFQKTYEVADYLKLLTSKPLAEKPGSTYRYNNYGYSLLGLTVEKVAGESLDAQLRRRVFEPVGMTKTRFFSLEAIIPNRSGGYRWRDGQYENTLPLRPRVFDGSGGLVSTLTDFVRYEQALRERQALSGALLDFQWTPYGGAATGYGAGWHRRKLGESDVLSHTGTSWGATSAFLRDLTRNITVIVFRNSDAQASGRDGTAQAWAEQILRLRTTPTK